MAVDNDRAVDIGTDHGTAQGVEVSFQGSGRVADGDAVVREAGESLLDLLNDVMEGDELLDFDFAFFLGDIDDFDFATAILGPLLQDLDEFGLFSFDTGA